MNSAPALQVVAKHGAGVDNIDVEAATARGVIVTNTGGTNAPAVAEAAVTLMLSTLRRVPEVHGSVVDRDFDKRRSEEHTSELQSLMRISYAVFCLKKKQITHRKQRKEE